MVAGGRNVRMNRQQMESRRKKQQIRWISLLARVAVLVVIAFCIRNIYARLEEMQMELERLEIQQYGMAQTSADAQSPDKLNDVPKLYGIKVSSISRGANNMRAVIDNGGIIICAMGKGDFTISGHYIVIYGYDNEGFMVNDPNCVARSGRRWAFSEIENQIKSIWVYDKEK